MEAVGVGSFVTSGCASCFSSGCVCAGSIAASFAAGGSVSSVFPDNVLSPAFCRVSSANEQPVALMVSASARTMQRMLVFCFFVRNKIRSLTGGPARLKAAFFRGACASITRA